MEKQVGAARQAADTAVESAAKSAAAVTAAREAIQPLQRELKQQWTRDQTIAPLQPLTPEQLAWSYLQASGVYSRTWAGEAAKLEKESPGDESQRRDPQWLAQRKAAIEQRVHDKLKGNVGVFVRYYAAGAGQPQGDFFATADQALFAANGGTVLGWLNPSQDNVTARIIQAKSPQEAAQELYLAIANRFPSDSEIEDVAHYLEQRKDRRAAAIELAWALLNSAEFRFNH